MTLQLLFFASLREALGSARESVVAPEWVRTVGELRQWLAARGGAWAEALAADRVVRAAVDQVMVKPDAPLRDGAEVAFFPPVTGG
ncbi:molybdopterin converting factor subunit 1 [Pigmentiphaga soli]|uniref:Molybdopterin synthase sulfur carrier subunit n=1 Tax=Pigmentiphaga soli TaxID=1007095 RepID=A0ABP8H920_9BURK